MEDLKKFIDNTNEWDLYNGFFLNNDIERLRKFLVREHFFRMSLELPGDIVEVGVFKGTGIAQMLKLREIFIPASNKKVIGFDLFTQSSNYKKTLNTRCRDVDCKSLPRMHEQLWQECVEQGLPHILTTKV